MPHWRLLRIDDDDYDEDGNNDDDDFLPYEMLGKI